MNRETSQIMRSFSKIFAARSLHLRQNLLLTSGSGQRILALPVPAQIPLFHFRKLHTKAPVLDALVVGAGFSGLYLLHHLRQAGFAVKIYEAAGGIGGTWWLNRYPGARVDSDVPIYQYFDTKLAQDFVWTERFPGYQEILRYFNHVDSKLSLSKDIYFNTCVTSAQFDCLRNQWLVNFNDPQKLPIFAKHLFLCTGFASKKYTPPFKGLDKFKGSTYHSNSWPREGVDLTDKRVAVIGTGASGVQIIQEIGPIVKHLTVYQRTPNMALPMRQYSKNSTQVPGNWSFPEKSEYQAVFDYVGQTTAGFNLDFLPKSALEVTPAERRELYETLYKRGGFAFWLGNYYDILFNKEANATAYAFWREKTLERLKDPAKQEILAPKTPPHAWGIKRPCLEQSYYEVFNQDNVDVINVRNSPILEVEPEGIRTEIEGVIPADVIVLATGFDAITGGILKIGLKNGYRETLQEKWKSGTSTFLGMTTAGFPNLYWTFGPQAPTAFSNGPTCIDIQGAWLVRLMIRMRAEKWATIEATEEGEDFWGQAVRDLWNASLFPGAESWYQGANIPGKPREPLNYVGGLRAYVEELTTCEENDYLGFKLRREECAIKK